MEEADEKNDRIGWKAIIQSCKNCWKSHVEYTHYAYKMIGWSSRNDIIQYTNLSNEDPTISQTQ